MLAVIRQKRCHMHTPCNRLYGLYSRLDKQDQDILHYFYADSHAFN